MVVQLPLLTITIRTSLILNMYKQDDKMVKRQKTIDSFLRNAGIPDNLRQEAGKVALKMSEHLPRRLTLAAGVGMIIASRKREMNYNIKDIAEMLKLDLKALKRALTTISKKENVHIPSSKARVYKPDESQDMLFKIESHSLTEENVQDDPRLSHMNEMSIQQVKYELLAQQQRELLPAKHKKLVLSDLARERILDLIQCRKPKSYGTIAPPSLLEEEKHQLINAIGYTLVNNL